MPKVVSTVLLPEAYCCRYLVAISPNSKVLTSDAVTSSYASIEGYCLNGRVFNDADACSTPRSPLAVFCLSLSLYITIHYYQTQYTLYYYIQCKWVKNERVAVAVYQWISHALCMATSRRYAKNANYHFCDLIEM